MHCLSSVYFMNQPLHVLGIFVAHHQEIYCVCVCVCVYIYIYTQQLVHVVLKRGMFKITVFVTH